MEKIVLKKILSENPVTYGNPIDFYFTIPTSSFFPYENRNFPFYYFTSVQEESTLSATDP